MKITSVAIDEIKGLLPYIDDLILRGCDHSFGEITPTELIDDLFDGKMQLWVVYDERKDANNGRIRGIIATRIFKATSQINIAEVSLMAGDGIAEWVHLVTELEAWARAHDCSKIQALTRKGLVKYLSEWTLTSYIVEKDLRDGEKEIHVRNENYRAVGAA